MLFLGIGIIILLLIPGQVTDGTTDIEVGPRCVPKIMAIIMIVFSSLLILNDVFLQKDNRGGIKLAEILPTKEAVGVLVLIAVWLFGQYYLSYIGSLNGIWPR